MHVRERNRASSGMPGMCEHQARPTSGYSKASEAASQMRFFVGRESYDRFSVRRGVDSAMQAIAVQSNPMGNQAICHARGAPRRAELRDVRFTQTPPAIRSST